MFTCSFVVYYQICSKTPISQAYKFTWIMGSVRGQKVLRKHLRTPEIIKQYVRRLLPLNSCKTGEYELNKLSISGFIFSFSPRNRLKARTQPWVLA